MLAIEIAIWIIFIQLFIQIVKCFLGLLALLRELDNAAAELLVLGQHCSCTCHNTTRSATHQLPAVRRRGRRRRPRRHRRRRAMREQGDPRLAEMVVPRWSGAGQLQPASEGNLCRTGPAPPGHLASAELVTGRFACRFPEPRNTVQEQGDPNPSELV